MVEADPARAAEVARQLGMPRAAAACLVGRGFLDPAVIREFLSPRLSTLSDPFLLPAMEIAVARIWRAIDGREGIAVYGDYDADGVTATALAVAVLRRLGASVTPFIPDRMDEGYGLSEDGLRRCIETCSPRLIVTVDCGTSSSGPVSAAAAAGVDVIVTDHHEPGGTVAPALAVVNPKLGGPVGLQDLAGVGIAFKLCHALLKRGRELGRPGMEGIDLRRYLEWVAIGTVADVVPLRAENRVFVRHGVERLGRSEFSGLRALARVAGLESAITEHHLGFVLGPRINAAGRMGDARSALDLLLAEDEADGERLAKQLDAANAARKTVEREILRHAETRIARTFDREADCGIVVGDAGWHPGVIGIVASRLCSAHRCPVVVVAFDAEGRGRGSCRAIEGFDLVDALGECAHLLDGFGGHRAAAGLWVARGKFEDFQAQFSRVCTARLKGQDRRAVQRVDSWIELGEADKELLDWIDRLGPFGEGHPRPIWAARNLRVLGPPRIVGGDHLKLMLAGGGRQIPAIGFGMGARRLPDGPIDCAFALERDQYMGRDSLQLRLEDFRPSDGSVER